MYIVVLGVGSIVDSCIFCGPFDTREAALEYAERQSGLSAWAVAALHSAEGAAT